MNSIHSFHCLYTYISIIANVFTARSALPFPPDQDFSWISDTFLTSKWAETVSTSWLMCGGKKVSMQISFGRDFKIYRRLDACSPMSRGLDRVRSVESCCGAKTHIKSLHYQLRTTRKQSNSLWRCLSKKSEMSLFIVLLMEFSIRKNLFCSTMLTSRQILFTRISKLHSKFNNFA